MIELLLVGVIGLTLVASGLVALMYVVKLRMDDRLEQLKHLEDRVEHLDDKMEDTRDYILGGDLERALHQRKQRGAND